MKGGKLFGGPTDLDRGCWGQVVNKISEGGTTSFRVLFGNHSNDSHPKLWLFVPQSLK